MNNDGIKKNEIKTTATDSEALICPFCMTEIPVISFSISDDIIYLHVNCHCVNGVKTIELAKYYSIFQSSLKKKVACNYNPTHYDHPALLYCDKCTSWLCNDCLGAHKTKDTQLNHVLLPREVHLSCQRHQTIFSLYCNDCKLNICLQCVSDHGGHCLHEITQVSNSELISNSKTILDIIQRNHHLKDEMIKMINIRILELTKWKDEIEILYFQNTKMNNEFVKLINLINKTHDLIQHCPNYVFDQIYTNFLINNEVVSLNNTHTIDENYIITKNHFLNSFLLTLKENCEVKGITDIEINDEVFNQENVQSRLIATLEGHTNSIKCLIELSDGRIASASWDNTIKLWDLSSMKLDSTLEGHSYFVWSIVQLKDGRLASCSGDNTIRIWDLTVCMCMNTITGDSFTFITQLNNGTLATCSKEKIQLWDINKLECLYSVNAHSKSIWCLIELRDGRLACCALDGTIKFWESTTLEYIETIKANAESVNYILQLKDERLVSCSDDKRIKVWDVNTFKYISSFIGHRSWIFIIQQLSDGRLVSSANDKSIRFWDISNYKCLDIIQQNDSSELVLLQLKDGRLASASGDWLNNKTEAVIKIWKV